MIRVCQRLKKICFSKRLNSKCTTHKLQWPNVGSQLGIYRTYKPSMEETEEREAAALLGSLSLSLSLSLLKRVADVPTHPLERMRKHSSILGVGIIIFRKYAHVPSRGRSGNGLQNLLKTELQHILLQEQQGLGFRNSFLGKSVQTRTSASMSTR